MWAELLLAFIGLFSFLYWYRTRNYGYFRSRGIPEIPSRFPFGSDEATKMNTGRLSFIRMLDSVYEQYKQLPVVGYINSDQPTLIVNDLDLVKKILIKDFDHFADRRPFNVPDNRLSNKVFRRMLTSLDGDQWKQIRTTLSPVFTSGKLKSMTAMINTTSNELIEVLIEKADSAEQFQMKEVMVNYMVDNIARCGFGVEANALKDKDSKFKEMVMRFIGQGSRNAGLVIKFLLIMNLPTWLTSKFNFSMFDEESIAFLVDIIRQSLAHRKSNEDKRNDFIDLSLAALKNEVTRERENEQFENDALLSEHSLEQRDNPVPKDELEIYLIANLFLLFVAGFDTSSTTLTIASYYLAKNPDVQDRLYNEIIENINDEGIDSIDYAMAQSLHYLDRVVNETLRIYPLTFLERKCTKAYKLPGTNFVVPEGMIVQIPHGGIMKDERYFPDGRNFNPDNFSDELNPNRNPYAFLAFGQGPRNCLGMRFALMSVKICLIKLVKNYKILTSVKTPTELVVDPLTPSAQPKGGVWLKIEKRH